MIIGWCTGGGIGRNDHDHPAAAGAVVTGSVYAIARSSSIAAVGLEGTVNDDVGGLQDDGSPCSACSAGPAARRLSVKGASGETVSPVFYTYSCPGRRRVHSRFGSGTRWNFSFTLKSSPIVTSPYHIPRSVILNP